MARTTPCPQGYHETSSGGCATDSILKPEERLSGTPFADSSEPGTSSGAGTEPAPRPSPAPDFLPAPPRMALGRALFGPAASSALGAAGITDSPTTRVAGAALRAGAQAATQPGELSRRGIVGTASDVAGAAARAAGTEFQTQIETPLALARVALFGTEGMQAREADKTKAKADTKAITQAAAAGSVGGDGSLNAPKTRTAPPPAATPIQPGSPKTEAQEFQSRTQPIEYQGRIIWADPESAKAYIAAGGKYAERGRATAMSGNREDVVSQGQGAQVAKGSEGTAIFRPSQRVQLPTPPDRRPFSAQVESLEATMPKIDVTRPGSDWSFSGGVEGGFGPRQGTRTLSGLEQATSRTAWLDRRAREERAQELQDAMNERAMALAKLDPLEQARIEAAGRYGGRVAEVQMDVHQRAAAVQAYDYVTQRIQEAHAEMSKTKPGSPEESRLRSYIQMLEMERRERANILIGQRITDPREDRLASLFSGLGAAPGAGTPTTGAR